MKQTRSKLDVLVHSARLQILHALDLDRRVTLDELQARLVGMPHATLEEHLAILVEAGMISGETIRTQDGVEQRAYRVVPGETTITPAEKRLATPADHLRYFTTFVAGIIENFSCAIKRPGADVAADRIHYRQRTMFLTDEELDMLLADIEMRMDREDRAPSGVERKPHVISWIVLPEIQPERE